MAYSYDRPAPPPGYDDNALDIGVFDERGIELVLWLRTEFTISASDATPGYRPGPVHPADGTSTFTWSTTPQLRTRSRVREHRST